MKEQEWEQLRARGLGLTVEQVRRVDREREDRVERARKSIAAGTYKIVLATSANGRERVVLVGDDGERFGEVYFD